MDNSELYKELKKHLRYIQENINKEVLYIALTEEPNRYSSFAITLPKNKGDLLLVKNGFSYGIETYDFSYKITLVDLRDIQELNDRCNRNF